MELSEEELEDKIFQAMCVYNKLSSKTANKVIKTLKELLEFKHTKY
jgi:hypothetical protein